MAEFGRRQFVATLGVAAGLAATATAGAGRALACPGRARQDGEADGAAPATDPAVARLFGDIRPGARLDRWSIEAVHPVRMGAIPVVLRTARGDRFQVDVLRRDVAGGPQGVANTPSLSLFVANRGDGSTATDEEQGLGAMALAAALAERESAGAQVPELLTLRERRARHPLGGYSVLS